MKGDDVKGLWYMEDAMGGSANVLEVGAGAGGGPGLVAVFEMRELAEPVVERHNRLLVGGDRNREAYQTGHGHGSSHRDEDWTEAIQLMVEHLMSYGIDSLRHALRTEPSPAPPAGERVEEKLRRVQDFLRFHANSEGGLAQEIEDTLRRAPTTKEGEDG